MREIELIEFFKALKVEILSVDDDEKSIKATYKHNGKSFTTKPLYYKRISEDDNNVTDPHKVVRFFNDNVYWLDVSKHAWPRKSEESDLNKVIADIAEDDDREFKSFLETLANNEKTGYIQQITQEGRPSQYYHNLENNNHWHDLVLLIKALINSRGERVDKDYFKPLVFKWDGDKNSERRRSTLGFKSGSGEYKMIKDLRKLIKRNRNTLEMKDHIECLKENKQIILQGPPGTGKTYNARKIAAELVGEDFDSVMSEIGKSKFLSYFKPEQELPTLEGKKVKVSKVNDDSIVIKYGENLDNEYSVSYDQAKKVDSGEIQRKDGITYAKTLSIYAKERYLSDEGYYKIIQFHPSYTYEDFVRGIEAETEKGQVSYRVVNKVLAETAQKALENETKNYVLIIDEINRANLPAVLGELIYALEYRGEAVNSMYKDEDGESKIILPENLYIIGTMNTADRSVGHIDYAIRRRFAFVPMLPEESVIETKKGKELFDEVAELFTEEEKYLSPDFSAEDVQIGHSYFMGDEDKLEMRMKYEIKPILYEYVKDGVLLPEAKEKINDLQVP